MPGYELEREELTKGRCQYWMDSNSLNILDEENLFRVIAPYLLYLTHTDTWRDLHKIFFTETWKKMETYKSRTTTVFLDTECIRSDGKDKFVPMTIFN